MWLLTTDRAELVQFASPEDVPGGYAILSHTWGEQEQTFQDLHTIYEKCRSIQRGALNDSPLTDKDSPVDTPLTSRQPGVPLKRSHANVEEEPGLDTTQPLTKKLCQNLPQAESPLSTLTITAAPTAAEGAMSIKAALDELTNPRNYVCTKLRKFCILAQSHGYDYAWADTCCIDKTSSADLSEALNSMFRYYSLAQVCYVYLFDVPSNTKLDDPDSAFAQSRWHRRGWTLQELLASRMLLFVSSEWVPLRSKAALAGVLEKITFVPKDVLTFERDVADTSVAQRMSWAALRETKFVEDQAYCLMGIFGVNIAPMYGEGANAFYRLQEEIMRTSVDMSILAWGKSKPVELPTSPGVMTPMPIHDCLAESRYLLAPSPKAFSTCTHVAFDNRLQLECEQGVGGKSHMDYPSESSAKIPALTFTSYGTRARIPIIRLPGCIVAVLFCSDKCNSYPKPQPLGLFLTTCPDAADPGQPLYHTNSADQSRIAYLGDILQRADSSGILRKVENIYVNGPKWADIHLASRPPFRASGHAEATLALLNSALPQVPFRVPGPALAAARTVLELELREVRPPLVLGWDGSNPVMLVFRHQAWTGSHLTITLGRCTCGDGAQHWARMKMYNWGEEPAALEGHTDEDHIKGWEGMAKLSEPTTWSTEALQLSFKPSLLNPAGSTLELHMGRAPPTSAGS